MSNITLLGDQIPSAPPAQKTHTRRLYGMSTRGDVGADSHAPSIVASCKQTRFHTIESTSSAEVTVLPEIPPSVARQLPLTSPTIQLSVEGLSISILPSKSVTKKSVAKSKAPATTRAVEILADADLKLKGGVRYGLLGRNGTGKSSATCRAHSLHRASRLTGRQPCFEPLPRSSSPDYLPRPRFRSSSKQVRRTKGH